MHSEKTAVQTTTMRSHRDEVTMLLSETELGVTYRSYLLSGVGLLIPVRKPLVRSR